MALKFSEPTEIEEIRPVTILRINDNSTTPPTDEVCVISTEFQLL